jgi:hypothetical protein
MQNKQLKRPYFPPEITTVEFRVERGLETSDPVQLQIEQQSEQLGLALTYQYFMNGQNVPLNDGRGFEGFNTPTGGGYFGGGTDGTWF